MISIKERRALERATKWLVDASIANSWKWSLTERAAISKATGRVVADDAAPECTCAAKDMTFGRCCKMTPNTTNEPPSVGSITELG